MVQAALNHDNVAAGALEWQLATIADVAFRRARVLRDERSRQIRTINIGEAKLCECVQAVTSAAEELYNRCVFRPLFTGGLQKAVLEFFDFLFGGLKTQIGLFPGWRTTLLECNDANEFADIV